MNCGGTYVAAGRSCQGCPSCDYVAAAAKRTRIDGRSANGGRRPGAGAKPTGRTRAAWVRVAVHREQREMWAAAAEAAGTTVAEAVRDATDAWARGALAGGPE